MAGEDPVLIKVFHRVIADQAAQGRTVKEFRIPPYIARRITRELVDTGVLDPNPSAQRAVFGGEHLQAVTSRIDGREIPIVVDRRTLSDGVVVLETGDRKALVWA